MDTDDTMKDDNAAVPSSPPARVRDLMTDGPAVHSPPVKTAQPPKRNTPSKQPYKKPCRKNEEEDSDSESQLDSGDERRAPLALTPASPMGKAVTAIAAGALPASRPASVELTARVPPYREDAGGVNVGFRGVRDLAARGSSGAGAVDAYTPNYGFLSPEQLKGMFGAVPTTRSVKWTRPRTLKGGPTDVGTGCSSGVSGELEQWAAGSVTRDAVVGKYPPEGLGQVQGTLFDWRERVRPWAPPTFPSLSGNRLEPGEPRYREGASKRQHNTHVLGRILADFATTLVYKTTESPLFRFAREPGEPVMVRGDRVVVQPIDYYANLTKQLKIERVPVRRASRQSGSAEGSATSDGPFRLVSDAGPNFPCPAGCGMTFKATKAAGKHAKTCRGSSVVSRGPLDADASLAILQGAHNRDARMFRLGADAPRTASLSALQQAEGPRGCIAELRLARRGRAPRRDGTVRTGGIRDVALELLNAREKHAVANKTELVPYEVLGFADIKGASQLVLEYLGDRHGTRAVSNEFTTLTLDGQEISLTGGGPGFSWHVASRAGIYGTRKKPAIDKVRNGKSRVGPYYL